ncbi:neuroendocrine convertase 1-like [Physella acuta]|uniref:neuroendocrine convertase 1-like n=1 Tax=Physella acuta TaxID=109671 RepID=UPI0027DD0784|nr:neuroendocrine convertase 1-like [Physella acuta]
MGKLEIALLVVMGIYSQHKLTTADDGEDLHYLNEWAVGIKGGLDVAMEVARQHGYTLIRPMTYIPDHYVLERRGTRKRSRREATANTKRLLEDDRVTLAEQQKTVKLEKRGFYTERGFNDPDYKHEWYLMFEDNKPHMNVKECWEMGYTGRNVTIVILDDGLEFNHPDLKDNYNANVSHDFFDNDTDPTPRYDNENSNNHGTRCAGVVSMMADNHICGVGIAFNSNIGAIRVLDGALTKRLDGEVFAYKREEVDIYSCSWGPQDNGELLDGPSLIAQKAYELGVKEGRGGKGSLYVWASGDGGKHDHCNADGYASNIHIISVNSATEHGTIPSYSERCASTMTTTYSNGYGRGVVSSDIHNGCTDSHTGTSASAPMAAGALALLLESNPDLTWRDVHHIVAHTSKKRPLSGVSGWYKNGAGYCLHPNFGFGLLDAQAMIQLANPKTWQSVGPLHECRMAPDNNSSLPLKITPGTMVEVVHTSNGCQGQENEVNWLERVQVVIDVDHDFRGRIYAELESPMGTVTPVFLERPKDNCKKGIKAWPLTSVHNWGEKSQGLWKFRVGDRQTTDDYTGQLNSALLILYGTQEKPHHQNVMPECDLSS